jgi:hypothetical protein
MTCSTELVRPTVSITVVDGAGTRMTYPEVPTRKQIHGVHGGCVVVDSVKISILQ